jgi:hypothetical protein
MKEILQANSELLLSYDIQEVKKVYSEAEANTLIKQRWKLILAFAGNVEDGGCLSEVFILGKPLEKG